MVTKAKIMIIMCSNINTIFLRHYSLLCMMLSRTTKNLYNVMITGAVNKSWSISCKEYGTIPNREFSRLLNDDATRIITH